MTVMKKLYGANMAFNSAVLAAETGTATVDSTTTLQACINGVMCTTPLTAMTNQALTFVSPADGTTAITATSLAVSQACLILSCVNAAGAYKNLQGPISDLDASDVLKTPLQFPNIPDTLTPFGIHRVYAKAASSGFVPATTFWDATGITTTVFNISTLPTRPLTA